MAIDNHSNDKSASSYDSFADSSALNSLRLEALDPRELSVSTRTHNPAEQRSVTAKPLPQYLTIPATENNSIRESVSSTPMVNINPEEQTEAESYTPGQMQGKGKGPRAKMETGISPQEGSLALLDFLSSPLVTKYKDESGALSLEAVKKATEEAALIGKEDAREIGEFIQANFSELARLDNDDRLTMKDEITRDDIRQILRYEQFNNGQPFWGRDPRVGYKDVLRGAAYGAGIGTGVQALSFVPGIGQAVTAAGTVLAAGPLLFGGMGGGFAGGVLLGNYIEGTEKSFLKYPLGVGGAISGGMAGPVAAFFAWGPMLGGAAGAYIADTQGKRIWNHYHAENNKRMFEEMRTLKHSA